MIQALTDNPTRTVAEVRAKLSRGGGNLGAVNSVAFMFDRKGQIYIPVENRDEDSVMERALEAGAEDFVREDEQFVVSTAPADLHAVKQALEGLGLVASEAALTWVRRAACAWRARMRRSCSSCWSSSKTSTTCKRWTPTSTWTCRRCRRDAACRCVVLILGIDPGTAVTGYGVVRAGATPRWWNAASSAPRRTGRCRSA